MPVESQNSTPDMSMTIRAGPAVGDDRRELALQLRSGIKVDLPANGHDCVITVIST